MALLRYCLTPRNRHPAQAEDVAAGGAHLIRYADKYGYHGKRIYPASDSAGGHLVSLVALDQRYFAKHGRTSSSLAGVVSISGLHDLAPIWQVSANQVNATEQTLGTDRAALKRASPITYTGVYCHAFRGVGSRSHRVHALTGNPHGGFALPLDSYPPEVWKTFMFDQEKVAKRMGALPKGLADSAREPLFALVNQARQGRVRTR